jgi:hypothetical protein
MSSTAGSLALPNAAGRGSVRDPSEQSLVCEGPGDDREAADVGGAERRIGALGIVSVDGVHRIGAGEVETFAPMRSVSPAEVTTRSSLASAAHG